MFRAFYRHLECLMLVLICLAAVQSQLQRYYNTTSAQSAGGSHDESLKNLFMALASSTPWVKHLSSPVQSPTQNTEQHLEHYMTESGSAPSPFPAVDAPGLAAVGKDFPSVDSLTHLSSSSVPGLPGIPSRLAMENAVSPSPNDNSIGILQPPVLSIDDSMLYSSPPPTSMWVTQPSPPARELSSPTAPALFASAPAPLLSPSSDTPNVTVPDAPLSPPSPGCCSGDMVQRRGLPSSICVCVYPIRLQLLIENVSTTFTNWSGVFQQDLASELDVQPVQIEITAFQFNSSNLSLAIIIGPLTSISFSVEEANSFKTKLDMYYVHFNSSIFGNYTLLDFQLYEPPAPSSMQAPYSATSPLPMGGSIPLDGESSDKNGHNKLNLWLIIVVATVAVVIVVGVLLLFCWKCHQRHGPGATLFKGGVVSDLRSCGAASIPRSIATRIFTFDELRQATNNFNPENVLGEGGFGRVYKGILKDGTAVAIKRFGGRGQGDREFVVEVEMLSRLHHRNLVQLVGYYASRDASQHLLCYELIPNGSLQAWLHGPQGSTQPLDWDTRLKIALDAARGLAYLHEDSQPCVIHRDFKASNILLENDFHAKVADFGLAKLAPEGQINYVATQVMGTFGYVAPEYAMTGHLLVKSDVYSYGVVLLELLSGRKPVDMSQPPGQENLVTWARPILRDRDRLGELVDLRLLNKYPKEDFIQVASIAAACVAPEASQRPTMGEVVQSLRMLQRQSEYTSGERTVSTDNVLPLSVPRRSFVTGIQNAHQHTSAAIESDGSSSVFSSGPFSGLVLDHEVYSRSAVFSEDLHEGR